MTNRLIWDLKEVGPIRVQKATGDLIIEGAERFRGDVDIVIPASEVQLFVAMIVQLQNDGKLPSSDQFEQ